MAQSSHSIESFGFVNKWCPKRWFPWNMYVYYWMASSMPVRLNTPNEKNPTWISVLVKGSRWGAVLNIEGKGWVVIHPINSYQPSFFVNIVNHACKWSPQVVVLHSGVYPMASLSTSRLLDILAELPVMPNNHVLENRFAKSLSSSFMFN